jgi:hypothetical protein
MLFEACVARIKRLIRNAGCRTITEEHDSLFESIQTAINYLFEPEPEPLRRKNSVLGSASTTAPLQTPTLPGSSDAKGPPKSAMKTDRSHKRQRAHFEVGDEHDDIVLADSSDTVLAPDTLEETVSEEATSPLSMLGSGPELEPVKQELQGKIVLEIADRLDAFETTSSNRKTSPRPRITRFKSSELPSKPSEMSLAFDSLSANFSGLNITSQFSSAAITNKLLNLARTRRMSSKIEHSSDTSTVLCRFDQVLGLTASLPSWKIYVTSDDQHREHAKSAMSVIYFSLLEEAVSCAVSASQALQHELSDNETESETTEKDFEFFCACIQRLSGVQQSVKGTFDAFEVQLERVVSKLSLLDTLSASMPCATQQDDIMSNDDSSRNVSKNDVVTTACCADASVFQEYEPLALACKSSAGPESSEAVGALDRLKAMSVKKLFRPQDSEIGREADLTQ